MHALQIIAGKRAYQRIRERNFTPDDIQLILGASGGPKWFVLSHLDRLINREILPKVTHPVELAGSSIGAWRMACYAAADPVAALQRLEENYLHQSFTEAKTPEAVSLQCHQMLERVLGPDYSPQLDRHMHIIAARCKGITTHEGPWKQAAAFATVAGANLISRKSLRWYFDRHLVQSHPGTLPVTHFPDFRTTASHLSEQNLYPALMASASIPMALSPVHDIPGSSPGVYRDGGMVDYHFDLPFDVPDGLILYPHFSPTLKPGWFDKPLKWRRVKAEHYQDVVMLMPTESFIASLPHGKIPDRTDFDRLSERERMDYWRRAVQAGERLADEFHEWVAGGATGATVKPFKPEQLSG